MYTRQQINLSDYVKILSLDIKHCVRNKIENDSKRRVRVVFECHYSRFSTIYYNVGLKNCKKKR